MTETSKIIDFLRSKTGFQVLSWISYTLIFCLPFERIPSLSAGGITIKLNQIILLFWVIWFVALILAKNADVLKKKFFGFAALVTMPIIFIGFSLIPISEIIDPKRFLVYFVGVFLGFLAVFGISQFTKTIRAFQFLILGVFLASVFGYYQFVGDMFLSLPNYLTGLRPQYTKIVFGYPRVQATAIEPLHFAGMLFLPIILHTCLFLLDQNLFSKKDFQNFTAILSSGITKLKSKLADIISSLLESSQSEQNSNNKANPKEGFEDSLESSSKNNSKSVSKNISKDDFKDYSSDETSIKNFEDSSLPSPNIEIQSNKVKIRQFLNTATNLFFENPTIQNGFFIGFFGLIFLLTFSKGATLFLGITMLLLVAFFYIWSDQKILSKIKLVLNFCYQIRLWIASVMIFTLLILGLTFGSWSPLVIGTIDHYIETLSGESGTSIERSLYLEGAFELLKENTLWGIGMGQYGNKAESIIDPSGNAKGSLIVNNTYIEVWLENGFIPLLIFITYLLIPVAFLCKYAILKNRLTELNLDEESDNLGNHKDGEKNNQNIGDALNFSKLGLSNKANNSSNKKVFDGLDSGLSSDLNGGLNDDLNSALSDSGECDTNKKAILAAQSQLENIQKIQDFVDLNKKLGKKIFLIFGGGSGARFINHWLIQNYQKLTYLKTRFAIIHLSGALQDDSDLDDWIDKTSSDQSKTEQNYLQFESLTEEMGVCLKLADLVMCRAGLGSSSELITLQKPAFLCPIPNTHQEANAEELKKYFGILDQEQEQKNPGIWLKEIEKSYPKYFQAIKYPDVQGELKEVYKNLNY